MLKGQQAIGIRDQIAAARSLLEADSSPASELAAIRLEYVLRELDGENVAAEPLHSEAEVSQVVGEGEAFAATLVRTPDDNFFSRAEGRVLQLLLREAKAGRGPMSPSDLADELGYGNVGTIIGAVSKLRRIELRPEYRHAIITVGRSYQWKERT